MTSRLPCNLAASTPRIIAAALLLFALAVFEWEAPGGCSGTAYGATPAYIVVPQPDGTQARYVPEVVQPQPKPQPQPVTRPVEIVPAAQPATQPAADPNVINVAPGQSWVVAVKAAKPGQIVRLAAGTWTEPLIDSRIRLQGIRIEGAGWDKTIIRPAQGTAVFAWCWDDVAFAGIRFTVDKTTDSLFELRGCHGFALLNCQLDHGRMNFTAETASAGNASRSCRDITIDRCRIFDATPIRKPDGGWSDSSGVFIDTTTNLQIANSWFDHNGWSEPAVGNGPATCPGTPRNHNAYIHASNTGTILITGNTFSRASAYGLQARAGGVIVGNWFVDNPIHLSFGMVNGAGPIVLGGVTGEIRGNLFVGTRPLAGTPRGYALEVSNTKDVSITGNVFAGDHVAAKPGPVVAAIKFDVCDLEEGNPHRGKAITIGHAIVTGNVCTWPNGLVWINPVKGADEKPKVLAANIELQPTVPAADVAETRERVKGAVR